MPFIVCALVSLCAWGVAVGCSAFGTEVDGAQSGSQDSSTQENDGATFDDGAAAPDGQPNGPTRSCPTITDAVACADFERAPSGFLALVDTHGKSAITPIEGGSGSATAGEFAARGTGSNLYAYYGVDALTSLSRVDFDILATAADVKYTIALAGYENTAGRYSVALRLSNPPYNASNAFLTAQTYEAYGADPSKLTGGATLVVNPDGKWHHVSLTFDGSNLGYAVDDGGAAPGTFMLLQDAGGPSDGGMWHVRMGANAEQGSGRSEVVVLDNLVVY